MRKRDNDPMQEINLTPGELAERWRTSPGRLANLRSSGTGPPFWKLGASVLYRLVDIFEYEAASLVDTSGATA